MQLGRGLVLIGGVAVIVVAAFLYFGSDRAEREKARPGVAGTREAERPEPKPFTPDRVESLDERLETFREKADEAAREREQRRASTAAQRAASPEAGSTRAAAERTARRVETAAGEARESRRKVADREQIEALFRTAAEASTEKADAPSGESGPEEKDEGGPESPAACASAGSPIVMTCASDPWICNLYNLAFQLPGTIPVASGDKEGIHIPFSGSNGEVWEKTPDGVTRHPTVGVTAPDDILCVLE